MMGIEKFLDASTGYITYEDSLKLLEDLIAYVIGVMVLELRERVLGRRYGVERGAYCQRNAKFNKHSGRNFQLLCKNTDLFGKLFR